MSRKPGTAEGMVQARRLQRTRQITEDLFLLLTAVCFVYNCKEMSKLKISFPSGFGTQLMLVMALVMIARLILRRKGRWEILWVGLPLSLVCMETYITTGRYTRLPFIVILIMGLDGIDYRKILRTYLVAIGTYITATVLAGLGGGVSDLVYYRDGIRSSWGTAYPTDFSSVILFLTMAVWLAWPELSNVGMLALGLGPILLALLITDSRNSVICGVLFETVVIYRCLEIGVFSRKRRFSRIQRRVDTLLTLALPVCAAAILLLVFLYSRNPESMEPVNALFSDRLSLSVQGFQNYPLLPFGNRVSMNGGMGGTVFFKVDQYFFLDSSYVSMLLRYGWVTTLGLCAVWIWMTRRAIRVGNRRMALVMAVVAVHSVMEHHFPDFFHNILLVMPLANLCVETTEERVARPTRRSVALGAVTAVLLALAALFLPRMMSWLRTIYGAMGWRNGEATDSVLGLNIALIAAIAGAAWAAYRLLTCLIERRQKQWAFPAVVFALCLALGIGVCLWGSGVIGDAVLDNAALVEADADALERLSDVTICSDVLPEVYRQRFGNIRPTVYGGEDLVRYPGATVLTNAAPEQRIFFVCGFRYARISTEHAIYTADPAAIAALEAGGYVVNDYYAEETQLDLEALAELNNLTISEAGVLLDGTKHSLSLGLHDNLYSGRYAVEYRLFLPEGASEAAGEVCELWIGVKGRDAIASVVVSRDQFDADGMATITVPVNQPYDIGSVDFLVHARKNRQLGVAGISYRQVSS